MDWLAAGWWEWHRGLQPLGIERPHIHSRGDARIAQNTRGPTEYCSLCLWNGRTLPRFVATFGSCVDENRLASLCLPFNRTGGPRWGSIGALRTLVSTMDPLYRFLDVV